MSYIYDGMASRDQRQLSACYCIGRHAVWVRLLLIHIPTKLNTFPWPVS